MVTMINNKVLLITFSAQFPNAKIIGTRQQVDKVRV